MLGLALATTACWGVWMAWDRQYVDPDGDGSYTGPYEPWQVVGCVLCLVVVAVLALRVLPPVAVVTTMPVAFTAAWVASAVTAPTIGASLWGLGAVMVLIGMVAGTAVVVALHRLFGRLRGGGGGTPPRRAEG